MTTAKPAPTRRRSSKPKVEPEPEPSLLSKLKNEAGGLIRAPTLEEVLDEINRKSDWKKNPTHVYFSGLFQCLRSSWYESRSTPCDHNLPPSDCAECRFDAGKAQPGVSTEDGIRRLYSEVLHYGKPDGPILNDIRFSIPIEVSWVEEVEVPNKPGTYTTKHQSGEVFLVGKTDLLIQGDNMEILTFTEIKSPIFQFAGKFSKITKAMGSKRVPLSIAGVQEPDNPDGVVSLNQVAQLAIGCKVLDDQGRAPDVAVLMTVSRANYRDHIEVLVTRSEYQLLYDLAVAWIQEDFINKQFDTPPSPEWSMGYQCKYCNYANRCAKQVKADGDERRIWAPITGIQERLNASHEEEVEVDGEE